MNDKTARGKLELLIAANFKRDDHVVTLTYADDFLPAKRKEAEQNLKKYLSKLRRIRKRRGEELKYIYVTESKHGEGRYHHHIVINRISERDFEEIITLWEYGTDIEIQRVSDRTFFQWSSYITKEGGDRPVGGRMWVCSLGLLQPTVTREYVSNNEKLAPPPDCKILEREEKQTEYGVYSYLKYIEDNRPTERDGCSTQSGSSTPAGPPCP